MPLINRLSKLIPPQTYPYPANQLGASSIPLGLANLIQPDVDQSGGNLQQLGQPPQLATPAMDAYARYVSNYPNPEQFKPRGIDRLTASLAGFSAGWRDPTKGVVLARDILQEPYQQALQTYATRGKGLEQLATIEERANANKRLLWNEKEQRRLQEKQIQATSDWREREAQLRADQQDALNNYREAITNLKGDELERKRQHDEAYNELRSRFADIREKLADVAKQRADEYVRENKARDESRQQMTKIAEERLKYQGAHFDPYSGDWLFPNGTKVKSGVDITKMSDSDRLALGHEYAMQEIAARQVPVTTTTEEESGWLGNLLKSMGITSKGKVITRTPQVNQPAPKPETKTTPVTDDEVKIADVNTGKVIGTIHRSEISKLDKKKYKVVE